MADDRGSFDLEVGVFPLQRLVFASQTHYQNGTLGINRAALLNAIAEPRVIADIEIHLAHPGESCRIVHVLDAVPVMAKVEGRSTVFPGFFGPAMPAGDGRNHRLRGAAVLVCGTFPDPTSGALSPAEVIIDMSGPAAPVLRLLRDRECGPGVSSGPADHQCRIRCRATPRQAESSRLPGACHRLDRSPRTGALSSVGGGPRLCHVWSTWTCSISKA